MAQHTDARAITVESVAVRDALVICHIQAGRPMFVMTCDDPALRWLASALQALGRRGSFVIGDGMPIASDNECLITVVGATRGRSPAMTTQASNTYRWSLPEQQARRMAEMIAGIAAFSGASHQYLDPAPGLPGILVSKGEYDRQMLRKMRASRSG